jgi:Zinc carboxypeptidase
MILFMGFLLEGTKSQDVSIYSKFFPDPEYSMPVPITSGNKSINYYTRYKDLVKFINALAAKHPQMMEVGSIGKTQQGRDQVSVILTNQNNKSEKKLRVTIISGIHGNEPIASEGILFLMDRLTEDAAYTSLLDHLELQIIPDANADGREAEMRTSSNGIDLNRDLTSLNAPESRNLKNAINHFDPQVVLDFHEFNPGRSDFKNLSDCYSVGYDVMFLYTGNLNVDPSIRRMIAEDFVVPTQKFLTQNHREVSDYATTRWKGKEIILNMGGTASRSSATNYALQNRISILMEIRGVTEGNKAVKRRIETSFLCATSYLRIAEKLKDQIFSVIDSANKRSIAGSRKIVVTSNAPIKEMPFLLVDECKVQHKSIVFRTHYNMTQTPIIARDRPGGYVIFPCSKTVKNILTTSGVLLKEVTVAKEMNVQVYRKKGENGFHLENEKINIPEGAVIIDAFQPMGNTVADLVEPEGDNSMYKNGQIRINSSSATLSIYRITHEQISQLLN